MSRPAKVMVNEIFRSIQGESTWAGRPCIFVRLTGCHLRCRYCDTEYAFHEGMRRTVDEVVEQVAAMDRGEKLVEVTGGEPLLQPGVHPLMERLCDLGFTVLVETSGACDIGVCDPRVIRIMDLKTPGSGEEGRNDWGNVDKLTAKDEVKFVLTDQADYVWAREVVRKHGLSERVNAVLLSAVQAVEAGREIEGTPALGLRELAEWVLADGLNVRVQVQMHKLIWDPQARGV